MTSGRTPIAGAIIAGGLSSRMQAGGISGDKFFQEIDSRAIIEHVTSRLSPQVDMLFINANCDPLLLEPLGCPVIPDTKNRHGGPLVGLLAALRFAQTSPFMLSATADCPFLPQNLVERLSERQEKTGAAIVLASSQGHVHPVFGLWHTSLAEPLEAWLADAPKASVRAFATHTGYEIVEFPLIPLAGQNETLDPFFNINRPDDLAEARRLHEALK
ncbi:molybdenum cofactor guanylyltransferase [Falsochrobactrum shanghaiense]|uniref:Molybdenum cofactor guanylyltransferase n=1 Tax=Falsochrobactrum shanghaiense TaxID=2201899 RepID=A0A316JB38_9HYPH|nr:molybdenum cofactor guanylyltransferase MobA [Falsochrobactrum shanghaiense]PWL17959.1 molybdenum cofactor guanylyltransferase [Falsochrobactrum shanghaiense]